jgi:hypothetical protein
MQNFGEFNLKKNSPWCTRKLSVFFFKLNNGNIQLFEQKNFKSKLENEKLTFIFVIFDISENNLGKIKK